MLSQEDIANQQKLLAIYRKNLAYLLQQAARYGGEHAVPLDIMHNIADTRASIQQVKDTLRSAQIVVDDKPEDRSPLLTVSPSAHPQPSPVPGSRGRIPWRLMGVLALIVALLLGVRLLSVAESPAQMPTGSTANLPGASNNPVAAPASGATSIPAASPDAAALPAPVFATPEPMPLPIPALNISNTAGRSGSARIAVDAVGGVHVVWLDTTPRQSSGTILHRSRVPDGSWSEVTDVTPDLKYTGSPHLIANFNRDICLVIDSVEGIYARCFEGGSWSPTERLGGETRNIFAPVLGADGLPRWAVGRSSVTVAGTKLDDGLATAFYAQFVIDANGTYHVVWSRHGTPYSIEHRFSNDGGQTWQAQERLSAADAARAEYPALAADPQGAVHLVWDETDKMLYRRWTAAGGWDATATFADSSAQGKSSIAVTPQGHVAALWVRNCSVFYASQRTDGSWTPGYVLNEDATPANCAEEPQIAIDAAGLRHMLWIAPGADGQKDVFYAQLSEGE